MKKNNIVNFFTFSVIFMVFQLASCQSPRSLTEEVLVKNPYTVTMTIDFAAWDTISYKYDAITFSDGIQKGKFKGRKFASKVRPHQPIKWIGKVTDEELDVILITVFRDPVSGGDHILESPYYDSKNGGKHIMGKTGHFVVENKSEELKEHYLISFAITDHRGRYDIYTVDPFLVGHDE